MISTVFLFRSDHLQPYYPHYLNSWNYTIQQNSLFLWETILVRVVWFFCLFAFIDLFGCTGLSCGTRWRSPVFPGAGRTLSCSTRALSCGMQDLVSWPGMEMEPGSLALGLWSLGHWTTREFPAYLLLIWSQIWWIQSTEAYQLQHQCWTTRGSLEPKRP